MVNLQTYCLTVCLQTCPCTSAEQWQQAVSFRDPPWTDHPPLHDVPQVAKTLMLSVPMNSLAPFLLKNVQFCLCQLHYRVKAKTNTLSSNKKYSLKLEIKDIIKVIQQNVNVISLNNIIMTSVADRYWEEGGGEENWEEVRMEMWKTLPFH